MLDAKKDMLSHERPAKPAFPEDRTVEKVLKMVINKDEKLYFILMWLVFLCFKLFPI